jgi:hypothetical protein
VRPGRWEERVVYNTAWIWESILMFRVWRDRKRTDKRMKAVETCRKQR